MTSAQRELLTVTRAHKTTEVERVTKFWNQVVSGKMKDAEAAALIKKIKENKMNYGGTFFSVWFRVNQRIFLHEVGFCGPFKEAKASYFVHVEVFQPKAQKGGMPNSWDSVRIAKNKVDVLAEMNEDFYVALGEAPVQIEASKWHLIQFMLDGPDTQRCEGGRSSVRVEHAEGDILFEFHTGSKQLPSMRFSLPSQEVSKEKEEFPLI